MNGSHLRAVLSPATVPYKNYPGIASIDIDAGRLCLALDFSGGNYLAERLSRPLADGYAVILREIQARRGLSFEPKRLEPHLKRAWEFACILSDAAAHNMPQQCGEDHKS